MFWGSYRNARKHGFVETMLGRRRYLPNMNSDLQADVATAERQAVNTIIQGSASELIKVAMLLVQARLRDQCPWSGLAKSDTPNLLMQIHDELVYRVPICSESSVHCFVQMLKECMESCVRSYFKLRVPLAINVQSSGSSWGNFEKYNV